MQILILYLILITFEISLILVLIQVLEQKCLFNKKYSTIHGVYRISYRVNQS